MEKYSEVIGLPVICVENGKILGTIKDLLFCPKNKTVLAFLLERTGCQILKKVIVFKDVINLGKDAMIVNDCNCIKELRGMKDEIEFQKEGRILGLKVYSKAGDDFGVVEDILFDFKTGLIEGIELSDGLVHDILKGRNVLPLFGKVEFSEENILVDREAVEEMMGTGGGLEKKLLGEYRKG